jgi:hypothetical protein
MACSSDAHDFEAPNCLRLACDRLRNDGSENYVRPGLAEALVSGDNDTCVHGEFRGTIRRFAAEQRDNSRAFASVFIARAFSNSRTHPRPP